MPYQTFDDRVGDSDSSDKLHRLRLPADLTGKAVLDLGCNEGFFCGEALRRGASRVIGMDINADVLKKAAERFPAATFLHQAWDTLPAEKFDVILFSSAIHYAKNPRELCDQIAKLLNPGGVFILECGYVDSQQKMWIDVQRHDGPLRFPTRPLLTEVILEAFTVRYIGKSITQKGDPLERHVLHCFPYKPIVLIVGGESLSGKTTLVTELVRAGNINRIDHDHIIGIMAQNKYANKKDIYRYIAANYDVNQINVLIDKISADPLGEQLVKEITTFVPAETRVSALEGYAFKYAVLRNAAATALRERGFMVWEVASAMLNG